jgi:hypothetical protein
MTSSLVAPEARLLGREHGSELWDSEEILLRAFRPDGMARRDASRAAMLVAAAFLLASERLFDSTLGPQPVLYRITSFEASFLGISVCQLGDHRMHLPFIEVGIRVVRDHVYLLYGHMDLHECEFHHNAC